jgi:hypothetical protein
MLWGQDLAASGNTDGPLIDYTYPLELADHVSYVGSGIERAQVSLGMREEGIRVFDVPNVETQAPESGEVVECLPGDTTERVPSKDSPHDDAAARSGRGVNRKRFQSSPRNIVRYRHR